MNRAFTNTVRFFLDERIPTAIRDSRWFMYPFFWFWFKGKKVKLYMDFKKLAWKMSDEEFDRVYRELDCRATDRPTDLNRKTIDHMLSVLDPSATSLLDVGCGRGYWLKILKEKTDLELTGCDVFDEPLSEGFDYRKGKVESLPFPDKAFDIVTCHHTIEHIRDIQKALSELKRVTKKQLIIVTPRQRYYYYTLDLHLHFFPEKEKLTEMIGIANHECIDCDGDWCYSAKW